MTKDFEPNDFQSNKRETDQPNVGDAVDTIEIKIGDRLLPKESYTDKPNTPMSARQEFDEQAPTTAATAPSEPKTRMQRRQMEIRESLLAQSASKTDDELVSASAESDSSMSREEKRKAELEEGKNNRKQKRQLKVRLIPVWLRILIILLLALIAVVVGTMIGYGVLGKGNPLDVFDRDTWTHIRDIVTKTK
jgi:hypothetical protein